MKNSILLSLIALFTSFTASAFDNTRYEDNPSNNYSAPAVTLFLNNLKTPVIRVVPDGLTWVEFPENISYCGQKSPYYKLDWLTKEDSDDSKKKMNPKVLSIESMKSEIPKVIQERLLTAPERVPDVQLLCTIGNGKQALIFLRISNDPHFIVKLKAKRKLTIDDLRIKNVPRVKKEKTSIQMAGSDNTDDLRINKVSPTRKEKKSIQMAGSDTHSKLKQTFELEYYRPVKKYDSKELYRILKTKGGI